MAYTMLMMEGLKLFTVEGRWKEEYFTRYAGTLIQAKTLEEATDKFKTFIQEEFPAVPYERVERRIKLELTVI